jgi:hypothetical protein
MGRAPLARADARLPRGAVRYVRDIASASARSRPWLAPRQSTATVTSRVPSVLISFVLAGNQVASIPRPFTTAGVAAIRVGQNTCVASTVVRSST